ncbi:hypothetical protein CCYA_CCYA11G3017 [Cyanidiococcus yangmingshanensis]|nr:hypothetical protein CCYA_CCYA11G3017 [Cyanidiococcus yangmingshanensis]
MPPKNNSRKFRAKQAQQQQNKAALSNGTSKPDQSSNGSLWQEVGSGRDATRQSRLPPPPLIEGEDGYFVERTGPDAATRRSASMDICIEGINLMVGRLELLSSAVLKLTFGRKYGLVGRNGEGKTQLLCALAQRRLPVPSHIRIAHVEQEVEGDETLVLGAVLQSDREREYLLHWEQRLLQDHSDDAGEALMEVYERLDELGSDAAETRASMILRGLGFDTEAQQRPTKEFSGGWRMRIRLAMALFQQPDLLLLDEANNHLDSVSLLWLAHFLKAWPRTVLMVSHDRWLLNEVAQDTILLHRKRLIYYGGNYDSYVKTRAEQQRHAIAVASTQQRRAADLKNFIARFGHGHKKMARQAQSRMKMLQRLESEMIQVDQDDSSLRIEFPAAEYLPPPPCISVNNLGFRYAPQGPMLYRNLNFGLDCDSRVAIIGPNGAGKSTFLKLLAGDIVPSEGWISRHPKLRIAMFAQHHVDSMGDLERSALDHMRSLWPTLEAAECRALLGRFGLGGSLAIMPMKLLSGGQKSRVQFAVMAAMRPSLMLFDEVTNHLDMATIDSLAVALNAFPGGVVLVTHDARFLSLVANEIWIVRPGRTRQESGTVEVWTGDYDDYKAAVERELEEAGLFAAAKQEAAALALHRLSS